ncbi:MAG: hypothetical protein IK115_13155 [Lachnospiraceae bacterium]|nr:hypothetical protein [Lachnospiraceae bacterium]
MAAHYDTYIVTTAQDFKRIGRQYGWLVDNLPSGRLLFVGSEEVGMLVKDAHLGSRVSFIDENDVLPIDIVWDVLNDHMCSLLAGDTVPRGAVGWYYQQFLKLQIAFRCENEYYMMWDGDTIPCKPIEMFAADGRPYLDNKNEYHELYFTTMEKLIPGMRKTIRGSFISEHMMFHVQTVIELVSEIEENRLLKGGKFWEKILRAIEPIQIHQSAFSEFETYGTYVAIHRPELYRIREWHSFRLGGEFFDPNNICERDYKWLAQDFDAISFEKNHTIKEGNGNLFDNPRYQEKLSPRKMLEIAQEEAKGGYIEQWGDNALKVDPLA